MIKMTKHYGRTYRLFPAFLCVLAALREAFSSSEFHRSQAAAKDTFIFSTEKIGNLTFQRLPFPYATP